MSLYCVNTRYSDGTIKLIPGRVVDLDDDTASVILRDSASVLQPLTEIEVAQIDAGLAQLSAHLGFPIFADWRPAPAEPHVATGGEIMHSGNMWGGR